MKLQNHFKASLVLALGLTYNAAHAVHTGAVAAGLAALPAGIQFVTDEAGRSQTFNLFKLDKQTTKKVGLSARTAVTTGLLIAAYKNDGTLPHHLESKERNDALLRTGIATGINYLYLSQTFQHGLRSIPGVGRYLACECEGVCEKCHHTKEIALGVIDTGVNFFQFTAPKQQLLPK
jgi:hypothetical protein